MSKIKHFNYCQRDIECGPKCKRQCDHCKNYYKPIEDNINKRLPRKIKKYLTPKK